MPGQESDLDTGLYHNGFRDYVPAWGRHEQTDPIGLLGGLNTYAYGYGNPLSFTDPYGLECPFAAVAVMGVEPADVPYLAIAAQAAASPPPPPTIADQVAGVNDLNTEASLANAAADFLQGFYDASSAIANAEYEVVNPLVESLVTSYVYSTSNNGSTTAQAALNGLNSYNTVIAQSQSGTALMDKANLAVGVSGMGLSMIFVINDVSQALPGQGTATFAADLTSIGGSILIGVGVTALLPEEAVGLAAVSAWYAGGVIKSAIGSSLGVTQPVKPH